MASGSAWKYITPTIDPNNTAAIRVRANQNASVSGTGISIGTGLTYNDLRNGTDVDYLVPHRVLIEGRADNNIRTKWELMDEFTLEHFSTRAHVYFSYPKQVKHIRITIQDWYGNTLMDDMRKEHFHLFSGDTWQKPAAGRHYNTHSSIYANYVLRRGENYTIGRCLDELPATPVLTAWSNTTPANFLPAREEWQMWKDRTIQSLWKGIYIPPFLFFGDNGEERQ